MRKRGCTQKERRGMDVTKKKCRGKKNVKARQGRRG